MQETIISNSSPIIDLAKIDQMDLLRDFFGELLIPEAVYDECMTQGDGRSIIYWASYERPPRFPELSVSEIVVGHYWECVA